MSTRVGTMVRVVVTGVSGRMGSTLARLVQADPRLSLAGTTVRHGKVVPLFPAGVVVGDALGAVLDQAHADVVVDFTSPEACVEHAREAAARGVALVVGTTGLTPQAQAALAEAAVRVPVVVAPNTSVGVNVVFQMAARLARALGEGFDVEIVEAHHRMKKDAPSGTALRLAEVVAEALGRTREDVRTAREGLVGARPAREIGVSTVRGGDVVGEHTLYFLGDGERVELTHRATSRDQFALGALRAAQWVAGRAPGRYDMADVLGLKEL